MKKGSRSPIVIAEELTILVDVSGLSGRGVCVLLLGDEEVLEGLLGLDGGGVGGHLEHKLGGKKGGEAS